MEAKKKNTGYQNPNTKKAIKELTREPKTGLFLRLNESLYNKLKVKMAQNNEKVMADVIRQLVTTYVSD
jgi:hypothetical protein